jgi:uncharacterized protein (TIGR03437 family)
VPASSIYPVTARVGGKTARVIQAQMSNDRVGVFSVWLEVPDLFPDLHLVQISVGSATSPAALVRVLPME